MGILMRLRHASFLLGFAIHLCFPSFIGNAADLTNLSWDVLEWNCLEPVAMKNRTWDTSRDSKSLILQWTDVEGGPHGSSNGTVYRFKTVQGGRAYLSSFGGQAPFFQEQRDATIEWRCRITELDRNGLVGLILTGSWFDIRVFYGRASREEKNWILLADQPHTQETLTFPWEDRRFHTYRLCLLASTQEAVLFVDGKELGRIPLKGNGEPFLTFPDFYPEAGVDLELDFFRVSGQGAFDPHGRSLFQPSSAFSGALFTADQLAALNPDRVTEAMSEETRWHLRKERGRNDRKICLCADWSCQPEDLLLNPGLEGPHRIHIGVLLPDVMGQVLRWGLGEQQGRKLLTGALEGKPWPSHVYKLQGTPHGPGISHTPFYGEFVELDAGVEDMTGRTLHLGSLQGQRTYITHVRFEPHIPSQRGEDLFSGNVAFDGQVLALLDPLEFLRGTGTGQPRDLWDLAATCEGLFSEVAMEVFRGAAYYPSEIFTSVRQGRSDYPLHFCTLARLSHPILEAMEAFKSRGILFSPRIAMNSHSIGTRYGQFSSEFAEFHSECWERAKDGRPDRQRLCYGHPAVTEKMLDLIRELANMEGSGLFLDFSITPPMMRYGDPLVAGFLERSGRDARDMAPGHPQWNEWLAFRASFLTRFMASVRQICLATNKRLTVRVPDCSLERNMAHGIDLSAWIQDRLVDRILVDPLGPILEDWQGTNDPMSPNPLLARARDQGIEVIAVLPLTTGPALLDLSEVLAPTDLLYGIPIQTRDQAIIIPQALRAAKRAYTLGMEGVAITELERSVLIPETRNALRRMRSPRFLE